MNWLCPSLFCNQGKVRGILTGIPWLSKTAGTLGIIGRVKNNNFISGFTTTLIAANKVFVAPIIVISVSGFILLLYASFIREEILFSGIYNTGIGAFDLQTSFTAW